MPKYTSNCPLCGVHYATAEQFCLKCTYPFTRRKEEKEAYVLNLLNKLGRSPKAVWSKKYARVVLYIFGAATILQGIYMLVQNSDSTYGFPLFAGALCIGLGLYTYKNAVIAVYIALTFLLGFYIFSILNQPEILIDAWLWYSLVFFALSYAFYTVIRYVQPEL